MNLETLDAKLKAEAARLEAKVLYEDLPASCQGLAVTKKGRRYIIIRELDSDFEKRVTFAHELAHITLGHKGTLMALVDGSDTTAQEEEAWWYAALYWYSAEVI